MARTVIVVPCFNEASRLDLFEFRRFSRAISGVQLVLVDDGSQDDTLSVLQGLQRESPGLFQAHHLPQNCGKAEAVRQGILLALSQRPMYVGFWDADLATPLDDVLRFRDILDSRPEVEAVCDRVLFLSHGRILLEGDPRRLPAEHGQADLEELFITVAREPLSLALE